jgi:hypothetical protein
MSTTAVDGTNVYGIGTPPSQLVAADRHRGGYRWASIVGDGAHHQAVSTANGVVYTVDTLGFLHAFNAETGLPIVRHATIQDTGALGIALSAAGIAIARNTLFVPVADQLVTYGLPA